jgi:hypothetical protein
MEREMTDTTEFVRDERSSWTDTEREVATIWADVLGVARVDIEDDFSSLGGDSFLATVCLNRIRKVFHRRIKMSVLLSEQVTLRTLASEIDASASAAAQTT